MGLNPEQIFREEIRAHLGQLNFGAAAKLAELCQKRALSDVEVSELYGWSPSTLRRWRSEGIGPKFIRDGRMVYYRVSDLEAYISSRAVRTRDQQ
jgi:predicted DNA-binding transcriptional regulator AlpA